MSENILKSQFAKDCKKLGISPFDFNDESGPWRALYLTLAQKGKPGRTNSRERISRVGMRIFNRSQDKQLKNKRPE